MSSSVHRVILAIQGYQDHLDLLVHRESPLLYVDTELILRSGQSVSVSGRSVQYLYLSLYMSVL